MPTQTPQTIRPAAVSGMFYPGGAAALREHIAGFLAAAERGSQNSAPDALPPKLLVVPHAGTLYSGAIAASAYALLAPWRDRISRVVLLGPAHRVAFRGLAAPTVGAFETPLGRVPIDHEALAVIEHLPGVGTSDVAHGQEHSLEVQLPFLQTVLGDFSLVPLAVGEAGAEAVATVLETLWGGPETLVVISTDLSHYLPYDDARRIDARTAQRIVALEHTIDPREACGAMPLNGALLVARRRGLRARLLDLRNSGDTAGDRARVVGYAALTFSSAADALAPH